MYILQYISQYDIYQLHKMQHTRVFIPCSINAVTRSILQQSWTRHQAVFSRFSAVFNVAFTQVKSRERHNSQLEEPTLCAFNRNIHVVFRYFYFYFFNFLFKLYWYLLSRPKLAGQACMIQYRKENMENFLYKSKTIPLEIERSLKAYIICLYRCLQCPDRTLCPSIQTGDHIAKLNSNGCMDI